MANTLTFSLGGGAVGLGATREFMYPVGNVSNFICAPAGLTVKLSWTDPSDIVVEGRTIKWKSTRVVRKTGSYPTSEADGTVVVESTSRNQYQNTPYTDSGLSDGVTYYYAVFTSTIYGVYSSDPVKATATCERYKVMSVMINENDSNPDTRCSYADDAVNMTSGLDEKSVSDWQKFFKYRPCLIAGNEIIGYLNPYDYTKFEDGSPSGIDSSNYKTLYHDGKQKVMRICIEFPKMGFKFTRSGSTLKVSITNDPNKSGFSYKAFLYNGEYYDHLYIDAYWIVFNELDDGKFYTYPRLDYGICAIYTDSDKLTNDYQKSTMLRTIQNSTNGDQTRHFLSFYENVLIQIMYLLQLKTTAQLTSLDTKFKSISDITDTFTAGPFYRIDNPCHYSVFGIHGYLVETYSRSSYNILGTYIDGIIYNPSSKKIYISSNGTYDSTWSGKDSYAEYNAPLPTSYNYDVEYIKTVIGDNNTAFIPQNTDASETTYYCAGVSVASLADDNRPDLLCICGPSFKVRPLYSNESYQNSIFSIAAVIDDSSKEVGFGHEYYADLVFRTSQYR